MPNTLAHVGAQGVATRLGLRDADLRWAYLGCLVPDLPWILQRLLLDAVPGIDPHALQAYTIAQASLLGGLLVCAAAALLAPRPGRAFAVLGGNVGLHLVLDALQTKWGSGAHFLAPVSWQATNWGWFWPESGPTYVLTALGLLVVGWHAWRGFARPPALVRPSWGRLAAMAGLLAVYAAGPLLLLQGPVVADAHSIGTLSRPLERQGHAVAIDRARYVETPGGPRLEHYRGRVLLRAEGLSAEPPATVSVRGVLTGKNTIRVTDQYIHAGPLRDYPSYLGLLFIAAVWGRALIGAYGERGRIRSGS